MSRLAPLILVLAALLALGNPVLARSIPAGQASVVQARLVVFETFMQPACNACSAAGPVIDQLAVEYAGQPVIFLEQNISALFGDRYSRWWAAHPNQPSAFPPLSMVDSGHATSDGTVDFHNVFQGQINASLSRPPLARLDAYQVRAGERLKFSVKVINLSAAALSLVNGAAVHALVFDRAHPGYTKTTVRAALSLPISDLLPGASGAFSLETPELSEVDWDGLETLVLVDYRPSGSFGAYDILQAAFAQPRSLSVQPEALAVMVDLADPAPLNLPLQLSAPPDLSWTASANHVGVSVLPASGSGLIQPVLAIQKGLLSSGWQPAAVTFTATGEPLSAQVNLNIFYGAVTRLYLPLIGR